MNFAVFLRQVQTTLLNIPVWVLFLVIQQNETSGHLCFIASLIKLVSLYDILMLCYCCALIFLEWGFIVMPILCQCGFVSHMIYSYSKHEILAIWYCRQHVLKWVTCNKYLHFFVTKCGKAIFFIPRFCQFSNSCRDDCPFRFYDVISGSHECTVSLWHHWTSSFICDWFVYCLVDMFCFYSV